jgi:hypothetical protein
VQVSKHLLSSSVTILMLLTRNSPKGEDGALVHPMSQSQTPYPGRLGFSRQGSFQVSIPSSLVSAWLRTPGRRWHTLGPGAGEPSIQAFVSVLPQRASSFLPSQPRRGQVRLRTGNYPDWSDHAVPELPCLALHWPGHWLQAED